MRRIWAVARRDFIAVVKTKGFLLSLFLTPLFLGGLLLLPLLANPGGLSKKTKKIEVVDPTGQFGPVLKKVFETLRKKEAANFEIVATTHKAKDSKTWFKKSKQLLEKGDRFALIWLGEKTLQLQAPSKVIPSSRPAATSKPNHASKLGPPSKGQTDLSRILQIRAKNVNFIKVAKLKRTIEQTLTHLRLAQLGPVSLQVMMIQASSKKLVQMRNPEGKIIGKSQFMKRFMTGLIFIMLLYMTIQIIGGNLVNSVIEEKSSRIMEVLLSSITPGQLMFGKVLGLGAAGLVMVTFFASTSFLGASVSKFSLQVGNLVMFVVYYALAFFLYSFLLAGIGSICTTEKEAQQMMAPVMLLLIIPAVMNTQILQNPEGVLAVTLSLVPFTAPGAMLSRMSTMTVPSYQIALSIGIMFVSALFILWGSIQVFRIGVLMYGKKPSVREVLKWIKPGSSSRPG